MAELILVRHGQASFGAENYDKLSELGWRQSRWLGEYFAERGASFDRVIRGSLRRHDETLRGIGEGMGKALEGDEDPRLNEYDSHALLQAHLKEGPLPAGGDRREHFRILREAMYACSAGLGARRSSLSGNSAAACWRRSRNCAAARRSACWW
jgi:broad specificity phosphatase PhoE